MRMRQQSQQTRCRQQLRTSASEGNNTVSQKKETNGNKKYYSWQHDDASGEILYLEYPPLTNKGVNIIAKLVYFSLMLQIIMLCTTILLQLHSMASVDLEGCGGEVMLKSKG